MRHDNLVFFVCGSGGTGMPDGLRFGMDYAYSAITFGNHSVDLASRVSPLSPVHSTSVFRTELGSENREHRRWLMRDSSGLTPTSDIEGCFDIGPNQFFPGRFHKLGRFDASPSYSVGLRRMVERGTCVELAAALTEAYRTTDINAWDANGETVLFCAARRGDPAVLAPLLLSAADPNCRARDGRRAVDHVPAHRKPQDGEVSASLTRALLLFAGGLEHVHGETLLDAISFVPEPQRRCLCSRFGIATAPELMPQRSAVRQMAKSAQVLFTRHLLGQAEDSGPEAVAALHALREAAGLNLASRRQELRKLLRIWHPDKHQGRPDAEKETANSVFCFVQSLKGVFLGSHEEA
ncbi:unnamed protein product [Polarella glacialis]|uniref:Uncharacterized protein n=1 Tax=Polarella glacialis TaxID=89957 RepID=A0A813G8X3_POLGL|nr:unnamed protein product [Polarella glacialis]